MKHTWVLDMWDEHGGNLIHMMGAGSLICWKCAEALDMRDALARLTCEAS